MLRAVDKEKINILCTHCNRRIKTVWVCERVSTAGIRYIYFCSCCQKVLGVSSKKGFANILK